MSEPATSDPARRQAPRALGRRSPGFGSEWVRVRAAARALSLSAAALLSFGAAHAQTPDTNGQIYIPGPGEARGAQPSGTISIPGPGEAQANAQSGMISIPGRGKPQTQAAATSGAPANGMIVIPGPGEANANANATQPAATPSAVAAWQPRQAPNAGTAVAANRSMPVVITAPQRAARATQPVAVEPPKNVAFAPATAALPVRAAAPAPMAIANVQVRPPAPAAMPAAAASALAAQAAAPASNVPAGQEDGETIRRAALAFLQQQTVGLPGKIEVTVAPTFPRGLAACTTLEPFMPTGARLWGRTTVGVRCAGAKPWTLYLQARVAINATYYLAARQIEPGAVVMADDLLPRDGDLSNLPRAIVTDPSQAIGSTAVVRISSGMPLRQDLLKSASAVTIGQTVRVIAQGTGFSISSEGSVMNNASPGQQVRVKMAGGQIISGIVKDAGTVEVQM